MSSNKPDRIVVFGATGHLGQEILARLEASPWSRLELVGVASETCQATDFDFRGEELDVETSWPTLREGDLVFVCTPAEVALDVVRLALRAQAACLDCTGVIAEQAEVPMPVRVADLAAGRVMHAKAPLLAVPSAATLAWAMPIEALESGVARVVGTLLQSASALGRSGLVALSEESIAVFNQSEAPEPGPSGQGVAFDVVPRGIDETRVVAEMQRVFGETLRIDVASLQVPSFLGEGASLAIELEAALDEAAFRKALDASPGLQIVDEGVGTRGLAAVEAEGPEPTGPTLRDATDADGVLVGRIRPDASLPSGSGWRIWLSYDPVRVVADHAVRLAALRFLDS